MSNKNSGTKIRKILIMGLDDAGKTSILLSLQRNTNLLSYCALRPTQGRVIVSFQDRDTLFTVWDFGGQEQYRTDYLQHLDEYFIEVDKIFFVIDIQDIERYDLAFDYLKIIIQYLVKNNLEIDFTIFLHKFDPNLEDHPDFSEERLSQTLFGKLREVIPPKFRHDIFKTTIYTIFKKTPITLR